MKRLVAPLNASAALDAYTKDPECMARTGLGGIIGTASLLVALLAVQNLLILPLSMALTALVSGYLLRVMRLKLDNPDEPLPQWNEWSELFFNGLNWLAIQFGIFVLAAIPATTVIMVTAYLMGTNALPSSSLSIVIGLLGLLLLFIKLGTHLFMSYLMVNYAGQDKVLSGFDFFKVVRYIARTPRTLITAWILAFQLQLLSVVIPAITLIGIFLTPYTLFAAQLVSANLLSQAWKAAEEAEAFTALPQS